MQIREPVLTFARPLRLRNATNRIILHHTAGTDTSAAAIHAMHLQRRGFYGIGYHYVIRRNGSIERGRPEEVRGVHAGKANVDSIGIAFTGNFTRIRPTEEQITAGICLIRDVRSRYGELEVIGHSDVGSTACPGRMFPWADLQRRLQPPARRTHIIAHPQAAPTPAPPAKPARRTHTVVSGDTL